MRRGLADFQPQIITVQFDQVEGIEEDALVSPLVTDEIERGNAVVPSQLVCSPPANM